MNQEASRHQTSSMFVHPSGEEVLLWTGRELAIRHKERVYDVRGFYDFIGVSPHATTDEIRTAIRRKSLECHPDLGGIEDDFLFLQQVKSVLLDPVARESYDSTSPFDSWLTPDDIEDMVRARVVQGDTRPPEEIISDIGITLSSGMSQIESIIEDNGTLRSWLESFSRSIGFMWSFQYLSDERDKDTVIALYRLHSELERAISFTDWRTYIRVGVRNSGGNRIDVEKGVFGSVVFWLPPGFVPSRKQVEVAVAYAASGCDYAPMLITLGKMALRSKERIKHEYGQV